MNVLNSTLIFLVALISVFVECAYNGFRHISGAQIDLLPPLIVYAALRANLLTMSALAVAGGLCFDSLSANLLGVSILPLFIVGFAVYLRRGLILREQVYAQFVLGAAASAVAPALVVILLLSAGQTPVLGWGSLWQWLVLTAAGGIMTPVLFSVFDRLNHALTYRPEAPAGFRPDREIARGR
jgi:rod shape-determining protein MreD